MTELIGKREIEIVVDVNCDVCGNSCKCDIGNIEAAQIVAAWGYNSRKDCDTWKCDLCEDCFDRVVEFIESIGGKFNVTSSLSQ